MEINRDLSLPLYIQVRNAIEEGIDGGLWLPGGALPTEDQLCERYSVSRITVKRAMSDLADEGRLVRIRGRGTFVAFERKPLSPISRRIALIVPDIEDVFIAQIYKGIETVALARSYQVVTYSSGRSIERENANLEMVPNGTEQGAIVFPYWGQFSANHILKMKRDGYPFVVIDRYFPEIDTDTVTVDNVGGASAAVRHLIDRGHRRIAYIAGVPCTANADRTKGYMNALGGAGIPYSPSLVQNISAVDTRGSIRFEPDDTGGYAAMQEIFRTSSRPTAVFACNDYIAMGAMKAIKEAGLRMPDDIAMVGFDDLPFCSTLEVPLTTIHQPKRDIGEKAAEILIDRIEGKIGECKKVVLPTELIERASSG